VRRVLDRATARAGVEWVSFHTFRHTCASLLFEAEKNVRQVADWLGHADPAFTLRTYVHLMDEGLGDAAFLDALVGNPGQPATRRRPRARSPLWPRKAPFSGKHPNGRKRPQTPGRSW
jgi:Phage integrase family